VIYGKKKAARLALRVRKIGDEDGFQISLKKGVNLVGRTSDPRLASDSYLSSQHARVTFGDEGFLLEDTESANGTFLRIREGARLQVGDSFIAGDRVFEVVEAREGKEGESDGQG
jgi:predicted component of type VI protein secretion system